MRFLYISFVLSVAGSAGLSQQSTEKRSTRLQVAGVVLDGDSKPVKDVTVRLVRQDAEGGEERMTGDDGAFTFQIASDARYSLSAEKLGKHSEPIVLPLPGSADVTKIRLILDQTGMSKAVSSPSNSGSIGAVRFADQADFTIAGVTDFTAVGGHGSDSTLRASESLAVETSHLAKHDVRDELRAKSLLSESEGQLKASLAKTPGSFEANHRLGELYLQAGRISEALPLLETAYRLDASNRENGYDLALACTSMGDTAHARKYVAELLAHSESADLYHLDGELEESLGDPLAAVRAYQKAVSLDPSEQNLLSWGSELLIHRAILQAEQVFQQGVKRYPTSSKLLTGLGSALFSSAAYRDAALALCKASELAPSEEQPYLFLGQVQMASPDPLDCVEQRLQLFQHQQPGNAIANYLYAMALLKRKGHALDAEALQPEVFLKKAIALDPKYSAAFLQLGIMYASRGNFSDAIGLYEKAIAADPHASDAYYRLAVAYDRTGQLSNAKREFALHDEVAKQEAAEADHQRQEVKQFVVALSDQVPAPQTQ